MMLAIVGTALLFWFGSVLLAYSFGKQTERREWAAWYLGKLALDPSDEQFDHTEVKVPDGEECPYD